MDKIAGHEGGRWGRTRISTPNASLRELILTSGVFPKISDPKSHVNVFCTNQRLHWSSSLGSIVEC